MFFDEDFWMTIFDDIETIFDNWKDSPGGYFLFSQQNG